MCACWFASLLCEISKLCSGCVLHAKTIVAGWKFWERVLEDPARSRIAQAQARGSRAGAAAAVAAGHMSSRAAARSSGWVRGCCRTASAYGAASHPASSSAARPCRRCQSPPQSPSMPDSPAPAAAFDAAAWRVGAAPLPRFTVYNPANAFALVLSCRVDSATHSTFLKRFQRFFG